ncbi:MAG TPA: Stp1/IreP family PP2C-type Ser/Thr phosphatase [Acidimicrobiales bacterium]|nr:Stp1/IreP family PP2C-type Ser/Thr phosphatase [Acidimicrobiales bacterium]
MTQLQAGAATDVGRVRQINEDRYLADPDEGLFAVADGVGGHQAGEVASQTSVETLKKTFTEAERTTEALIKAVEAANEAVWQLAQGSREKRGMGTTLTALALVHENGEEQLALANVGDSRAYLLQQGELIQLSEDHSLVEELVRDGKLTPAEAQVHPQRSIITRALGMEPAIEVDSWEIIPFTGDRILLCSDGLTNELSDERIASTLRQLADPQEAAHDLVRQARAAGGSDNITVVVVDVVDDDGRSKRASAALAGSKDSTGSTRVQTPPTVQTAAPTVEQAGSPVAAPPAPGSEPPSAHRPQLAPPPPPAPGRRFTWRVAVFLFAIVAVVGTAVWAMAWYARGAYYVGLDDEQVAIFRGRPGGMLWFDPTLVERKQQPAGSELLPAQRTELEAGHEVSSKAAADRYVNNLRQEVEARRAATTTTTPFPPTTTSSVPPSTTSTSRP